MSEATPDLDDDLLPSLPKPRPGERLFRADLLDWQNNACPHWYASKDNWDLIALGYLHAADALVDRLLVREVLADEMLYPVCFLYRQYIELRLKHIVSLGERLRSGKYEAPRGHNLESLWDRARPVLSEKVQGLKTEEIDAIGSQISELQQVDSESDGFRYPNNKKSEVSLDGLERVNLRHMRDVMSAMNTVLAGSVDCLSEIIHTEGNM